MTDNARPQALVRALLALRITLGLFLLRRWDRGVLDGGWRRGR